MEDVIGNALLEDVRGYLHRAQFGHEPKADFSRTAEKMMEELVSTKEILARTRQALADPTSIELRGDENHGLVLTDGSRRIAQARRLSENARDEDVVAAMVSELICSTNIAFTHANKVMTHANDIRRIASSKDVRASALVLDKLCKPKHLSLIHI